LSRLCDNLPPDDGRTAKQNENNAKSATQPPRPWGSQLARESSTALSVVARRQQTTQSTKATLLLSKGKQRKAKKQDAKNTVL